MLVVVVLPIGTLVPYEYTVTTFGCSIDGIIKRHQSFPRDQEAYGIIYRDDGTGKGPVPFCTGLDAHTRRQVPITLPALARDKPNGTKRDPLYFLFLTEFLLLGPIVSTWCYNCEYRPVRCGVYSSTWYYFYINNTLLLTPASYLSRRPAVSRVD